MGLENILENNGFAIALTGMMIVFVALLLISAFISLLPLVLRVVELVLPTEQQPQTISQRQPTQDEQAIAAIGFAVHINKMANQGSDR